MKQLWRPILAVLVVTAICGVAWADGTAPAATTEPAKVAAPAAPTQGTSPYTQTFVQGDDFDKWCEDMKKPCDWFCWGADYQYRAVYQGNNRTLNKNSVNAAGQGNNDMAYDRNRMRIWSTISVTEDIEINSRFMWAWWDNWEPDYSEATTLSEGLFDNLNIKFKNLFETKSALTVGRQDIMIGDGWLVADGTPFDGSRTGFFDAIRYQYEFENSPTTADLIFIDNHASSEYWLHPINSVPFPNAEQDEQGAIAYFTYKGCENTEISPYFIYKNADDQVINFNGSHLDWGYNADLYTPGIRITHKVDENWKWRAEGAYQFGSSDKAGNDRADVSAFGANTAVQYFTNDEMNNNFRLQYEFLSGDDPDSGQYEGFDILWGRWARFSDIYADAARIDGLRGGADFSNLHRFGPGWSFSPSDKFTLATDYYLLFADQSQGKVNAQTSDNGLFRGQLITSVLSYKFNKHIAGHLQGELLLPGNYYSNNNDDIASFVRYQIVLTF
jgi:hypothetical protein